MTTTLEARRIRRLHTELRELVRVLVDAVVVVQTKEDGSTAEVECPCLLDQLQEAIGTGLERTRGGGGSSAFGSKVPVSVGALDLWQEIQRTWCGTGSPKTRSVHEALRFIPEWVQGWTDIDQLSEVVERVRWTVHAIQNLLDPPKKIHISAPCPSCGEKMVRSLSAGEWVQIPALWIEMSVGCTCLACGKMWPVSEYSALAQQIKPK